MANRPLEGCRVLCGGKSQEDTDRLIADVRQLGGAAVTDCARDSPPDLVIASCVTSRAIKDARDHFASVPMVSVTWLAACRASGGQAPYEGHIMKSFTGLEISVSGGLGGEKQKAAELVKLHGGNYTPNMTRSCTHLVILGGKGDSREVSTKETHARQWKTVTIVWGEWLHDNAQAGHYKGNEKEFLVPVPRMQRPPSQSTAQRAGLKAGDSQAHASANTVAGGMPTTSISHAASEGSLPTIGTRVGAGRLEPEASRAMPCPSSTLPASLGDLPPASGSASLPGTDDDRDYLFLSGAIVHLACCTPAEHLEMLRILREGACTRRPDLRDDVTHIVVGSDLTRPEIQAIAAHMKAHGHVCKLCGPQWLRGCLASRHELAVTPGLELRAGALLDAVVRAAKEAEARQAEAAAAAAVAAAGEAAMQRRAGGAQFLEGLFFLLTPLLEGSDREFAQRKIRDAGGRLFDRLSLKAVPGPDAAFAVCPLSMPPADSSRLKDCPAFSTVPEEHRVTVRWLDVSQDRGQPLVPIPASWEFLLCKPLPHKLPLPGMKHVVATASLYGDREKGWIKMAIKTLLGGKYTVKMSARNTHLIVRSAAGPKFTGAAEYRVKPVTIDWLFQMANAGRLLPEAHFYPPLPADGENTEGTQWGFETSLQPKPSQAKAAVGSARVSQKRHAMAHSSQHNQASGAGGWRIGDRPQSQQRLSNVESLFSQLKSPAKPRQPGQVAAARPPRPASVSGSDPQAAPPEVRGEEEIDTLPEAAAERSDEEQAEEEEDGSDDDIKGQLQQFESVLAAQASRMMPGLDSQADPVEPLTRTRRMPSDQAGRPGALSGRGGKRAKPAAHSCSGTSTSLQSGDLESSQQVGYEDTVGSRPPQPRTRGSSRAAAASLREAEDKKLLERIAGAAGRLPHGTQDALLGD